MIKFWLILWIWYVVFLFYKDFDMKGYLEVFCYVILGECYVNDVVGFKKEKVC